jgi:D-alanyl-D-alanine carboxypeptidase
MNQPNPLKTFFVIVFGGLIIFFGSVGMFNFGIFIWHSFGSHIDVSVASVASAIVSNGVDGTSVLGIRVSRIIRYTASQEEDAINAAAQALPNSNVGHVTAKAYLVKDLTTGQVVVQKNSDQLLPIASLSKLVTAVVEKKLIPSDARIPITKHVMATYGNTAQFTAGEVFTAADLIYPMLMVSSNDAAEAFAQYYGRDKFIKAMNDFTQSIGAYRTYFADPSGLDPNNVSSANDLALIIEWIRKNDPDIIKITELKDKTVRSHTWVNPTHFLSLSYYVGGKNGYLPEANRTNVSLFKLGDTNDVYAVVVLGSANRDSDTLALIKKAE